MRGILMKHLRLITGMSLLCVMFTGCGSGDNADDYDCTSYDHTVLECPASDVHLSVVADGTQYEVEVKSADCYDVLGSATIQGHNRDIALNFLPPMFSPLYRDIHYSGGIEGDIRYAEVEMVNDEWQSHFAGTAAINEGTLDAEGLVTITLVVDGNESNLGNEAPRIINLTMNIAAEISEKTESYCLPPIHDD